MRDKGAGQRRFRRELRDPLVGKYLDRQFHILSWIGKGAYSNVYKAAQTTVNDRIVAVKVIRKAQSDYASSHAGKGGINPFAHELQFSRMLKHPAVVRVFHVGRTEQGVDFIAMEYVEGVNLDVHLRRYGPLSVAETVQLADQLLGFVAETHRLGFAHSDLKPDNIMMRRLDGGQVRFKILDLGQARFFKDARPPRDGGAVGTAAFIAPELAAGRPITPAAEVYAVGTILYQALTARRAIELDRPSVDRFVEYLRDPSRPIPTRPLRQLRPDCPERLAAIVEAALSRDPARRPPGAAQMRADILHVAEEEHLAERVDPPRGWVQRVRGAWNRLLRR